MNLVEYVKNLFSTVEKRDILNEIDRLQSELKDFTIVPYKIAVDTGLNSTGPNYYCKMMTNLYRETKQKYRLREDDVISGTYLSLEQLSLTLGWLRTEVEREKSGRIVKENIDFKQANFLRYIDAVDFYLRYARMMLLAIASIKTSKDEPGYDLSRGMVMAEVTFLKDTARYFSYLVGILSQPIKVTEKAFDAIPSVAVTETNEEAIAIGNPNGQMDVVTSNFIPLKFNIFFLVGKRRAERRVKRLREAEAAARAIELTLAKLSELKAGGSVDPSIDKQIDYYTNLLNKLQAEIEQINSEVA